jgi:hypothetical protein
MRMRQSQWDGEPAVLPVVALSIITDQRGAERCSEGRRQLVRRFAPGRQAALVHSKIAARVDTCQSRTALPQ